MLNKREQRAVSGAIEHLDPNGPASERIKQFLIDPDFRLYLDTWVLPDLRSVLPRASVSGDQ